MCYDFSCKQLFVHMSEKFGYYYRNEFIFRTILARIYNIFEKFHQSTSKIYRPEKSGGIFDLLMTFSFPYGCLMVRTQLGFHFRGEKCSKMYLKINRPMKTP